MAEAVDTMQVPRPNPPRYPSAEDRVARRIAYERARRGWSTAKLARRVTEAGAPINQSAIYKIEKGNPRRSISLDEALAIAEVFGLTLDQLQRVPDELRDSGAALARFFDDAEALTGEIGELVERIEISAGNLRLLSAKATPALEYLDVAAVRTGTGRLQERITALADALLGLRDWLAQHPIELRRGGEEPGS